MKKKEEGTETVEAAEYRGLLRSDGGNVKQVREFHCVLPLAGSGKIPWLRLLMTDDLGESWLSCAEPVVLGEECWEEGLEEPCRPWPEWERRWWSPSLCSFRGSHRGTLSSWAVLDRSMRTWGQTQPFNGHVHESALVQNWTKSSILQEVYLS